MHSEDFWLIETIEFGLGNYCQTSVLYRTVYMRPLAYTSVSFEGLSLCFFKHLTLGCVVFGRLLQLFNNLWVPNLVVNSEAKHLVIVGLK